MKKFFYFVAIVATVALTACGGGKTEQKLSAEDEAAIKSFADFLNAYLSEDIGRDGDYIFEGVWPEGRDIIISTVVNERKLRPGMTVKTQFLNADPQLLEGMVDELAKSFTNGAPPQAKAMFGVLRRCKCTIVYRYVGNISQEKVDVRVPCEKIPE